MVGVKVFSGFCVGSPALADVAFPGFFSALVPLQILFRAYEQKKGRLEIANPFSFVWSGREDLNLRPPRPERGALPDCATPRCLVFSEVRPTYLAPFMLKSKKFCHVCKAEALVKLMGGGCVT